MAQPEETGRRRGNIRQRGSSLQVRFFAGKDPVTGRDVYLTASIPGTDRKAHKRAEDKLADLRRCRVRCDGRSFIEHKAVGEHDCKAAKCKLHTCKPMAASTVRQIHSIISGTMNAAVRWDWASTNPTKAAQRPRQKPPQPDPPSPAMAAKLVEAAFEMDDDWGMLVWFVMTT